MPLESLIAANLLKRCEGGVRSTTKLVPHDKFFFVSDYSYQEKNEPLPVDYVLGVGPSSVSLACLTIRKPAELGLDAGAGAGVQAILASGHVKKIIATDTNLRAVNFGQFNCRLNGIDNIEFRTGGFFEPVQLEKFGVIAINPPFVISPGSSLLYRDSGSAGDGVSEHVVRGAAQRLEEGGFASMLINWHHKNQDDWNERPTQWLADNGCDGWLIRFTDYEPQIYAANWLRSTEGKDQQRYSRLLREWTDYYKQAGYGRISAGAVVMRKRHCSKNWVRHDSMKRTQAVGPCSEHIVRIFEAETFVQNLVSDADLLERRFEPHPDLSIEQHLVMEDGSWAIRELMMNLSQGIPFTGHADIHVLKLLSKAAGGPTVREIIQFLATESGLEEAKLAPVCLEVVKKLVCSGMLIPAAAKA